LTPYLRFLGLVVGGCTPLDFDLKASIMAILAKIGKNPDRWTVG
jgi:hypothetical protein